MMMMMIINLQVTRNYGLQLTRVLFPCILVYLDDKTDNNGFHVY